MDPIRRIRIRNIVDNTIEKSVLRESTCPASWQSCSAGWSCPTTHTTTSRQLLRLDHQYFSVVDLDPVGFRTFWPSRSRIWLRNRIRPFDTKPVQFNYILLRKYYRCLNSLAEVPLCTLKIFQLLLYRGFRLFVLALGLIRWFCTQITMQQTMRTLAFVCESCVFIYLGLGIFSFPHRVEVSLIGKQHPPGPRHLLLSSPGRGLTHR